MKKRSLTTEEFIERAKKVHGDRYDYSLVEYINSKTSVKIICSKHGVFEQKPTHHLAGYGCKSCGNEKRRLTTEKFIEKAKKVHGDKYSYSKTKFKNSVTKLKITCKVHGDFLQLPYNHLSGHGCRFCGGSKRRRTKDEFIHEAKKVHGDKYDYLLVNYRTSVSRIRLICPEHGLFTVIAGSHLQGSGCPLCLGVKGRKRMTTEEFIKRAKKVHGDKYDYSETEYTGNHDKVKITCSVHGVFEQRASSHLYGHGCRFCSKEKSGAKPMKGDSTILKKKRDLFIEKAKKVHGDKYGYLLVNYKGANIKTMISCPTHGSFEQRPSYHLKGHGCPACKKESVFIEKVKKIHNNKYDYSLVRYRNHSTRVKIICSEHGVFEQTPTRHLNGHGCPACKKMQRKENKEWEDLFAYKVEKTIGSEVD